MIQKQISDMTDNELIDAWQKGKKWLVENEQASKSDKNESGGEYNSHLYMTGLMRIEKIEDEMIRRKVLWPKE
jgi:hypothetical protein